MRILFAGTPASAIPTLQALLDSHHDVVGVITQPPAKSGRGQTLKASDVEVFALEHNLTVIHPESINDSESVEWIAKSGAELAVVVAYGQLLKDSALSALQRGWLNLHFSLLPHYRGAAPVQRVIMRGESVTGVSVFQLDAGMDTGPVFGSATIDIATDDTTESLMARLADLGSGLVVKVIDGIEAGEVTAQPQPLDDISYAPKISADETNIKWHHPALGIDRWIRGLSPEPGAWTTCDDARIGISPIQLVDVNYELQPGEIAVEKNHVYVGTGSQSVELGLVKPAGKNWMEASAWARGLRTAPKFVYVESTQ